MVGFACFGEHTCDTVLCVWMCRRSFQIKFIAHRFQGVDGGERNNKTFVGRNMYAPECV